MNGRWIGQVGFPFDLVDGTEPEQLTFNIYTWTPATGNVALTLPSGRYTPQQLAAQVTYEFGLHAPAASIVATSIHPDANFTIKFESTNGTPFAIWWDSPQTNVAPSVFGFTNAASSGAIEYIPQANGRPLPMMMYNERTMWTTMQTLRA
jgi:hypothetical protein